MPRIETGDAAEAERFLAGALERGHEGVMVKALDAPYEAGRRGGWLKVKPPTHARPRRARRRMGSRPREGRLSNIHLGARDEERRLRDAGQDLQGDDRRDAGLADRAAAGAPRPSATGTPCTFARSWSWKSRSTASSGALVTPADLRCGSPASRGTGRTRRCGSGHDSGRCASSTRADESLPEVAPALSVQREALLRWRRRPARRSSR